MRYACRLKTRMDAGVKGRQGHESISMRHFEQVSCSIKSQRDYELRQPIQNFQSFDALELADVRRYDVCLYCQCVGCDQQIIVANQRPRSFQFSANLCVTYACLNRVIEQFKARQKFVQSDRVGVAARTFGDTKTKLGYRDRRNADFADGSTGYSAQHALETRPPINQINTDVRIEQDEHQNLRVCGGAFSPRSMVPWKSCRTLMRSSNAYRRGNSSTPPAWRLTTTSSSSNRNSFGKRTAWLLPC